MPSLNAYRQRMFIGISVIVCLWLTTAVPQPAQAAVQPRVYEWQKRLSKAIPAVLQEAAAAKASEIGLRGTPEQIKQAAAELPCTLPRPALELFLGIKVLLLQDRAQQTKEKQLQQTRKAMETCDDYLYRLNKHKAGTTPRQPVPARDHAELLPESLSTPEWQLRLRLPSFDEFTTPKQMDTNRKNISALRQELEAEEEALQAALEQCRAQSHELRRYVLQLCDTMDPLTCQPYAGQRPTVLVIPPPPLDAPPLQ